MATRVYVGSPRIYRLNMGITHDDLTRLLPKLFANQHLHWAEGICRVEQASRSVEVRFAPERERRLGSLVVPETDVELRLEGYSESEAEEFLVQFEECFQKGGG